MTQGFVIIAALIGLMGVCLAQLLAAHLKRRHDQAELDRKSAQFQAAICHEAERGVATLCSFRQGVFLEGNCEIHEVFIEECSKPILVDRISLSEPVNPKIIASLLSTYSLIASWAKLNARSSDNGAYIVFEEDYAPHLDDHIRRRYAVLQAVREKKYAYEDADPADHTQYSVDEIQAEFKDKLRFMTWHSIEQQRAAAIQPVEGEAADA